MTSAFFGRRDASAAYAHLIHAETTYGPRTPFTGMLTAPPVYYQLSATIMGNGVSIVIATQPVNDNGDESGEE